MTVSMPDDPSALVTAATAPAGSSYIEYVQATAGPMDINLTAMMTPGLITLTLQANNTGVNFVGAPFGTYGISTRTFVFSVRQYAGGPFSWVPPVIVAWSGGNPGVTSSGDFVRDNYTIMWTGKNYMEIARALNVQP